MDFAGPQPVQRCCRGSASRRSKVTETARRLGAVTAGTHHGIAVGEQCMTQPARWLHDGSKVCQAAGKSWQSPKGRCERTQGGQQGPLGEGEERQVHRFADDDVGGVAALSRRHAAQQPTQRVPPDMQHFMCQRCPVRGVSGDHQGQRRIWHACRTRCGALQTAHPISSAMLQMLAA